jgi:hypothetical protein
LIIAQNVSLGSHPTATFELPCLRGVRKVSELITTEAQASNELTESETGIVHDMGDFAIFAD